MPWPPHVLGLAGFAALGGFWFLNPLGRPEPHEDADDVVPLAQQQCGGDCNVQGAAGPALLLALP